MSINANRCNLCQNICAYEYVENSDWMWELLRFSKLWDFVLNFNIVCCSIFNTFILSSEFISMKIRLCYILVSDKCCVESFRTIFFVSVYKKVWVTLSHITHPHKNQRLTFLWQKKRMNSTTLIILHCNSLIESWEGCSFAIQRKVLINRYRIKHN